MKRISLYALSVLAGIYLLVYLFTYHPPQTKKEKIFCNEDAPTFSVGQKVKILNWNIQYLAGPDYVFWYDENYKKDSRQSPIVKLEDIEKTFAQVLEILEKENPDIILFQELHVNSKRSQYTDQEKMFQDALAKSGYGCSASAYYLKNRFLPHPKIMGAENMKLSIFSKYKIKNAVRHQLPVHLAWRFDSFFNFKRTLLSAYFAVKDAPDLVAGSTHFDAFAQGSDTMQRQVEYADNLFASYNKENLFWLAGGDYNLLSDDSLYGILNTQGKENYNTQTELAPLVKKYNMVPSLDDITQGGKEKWFTHFPNGFDETVPAETSARTIDYIFYSPNLKLESKRVRAEGTRKISDHMPLIAEFTLQPAP